MKFTAYNIIILVFTSLGTMANIGSTPTGDFTREKINREAYYLDFEDKATELNCSNTYSETTFVISDNEEEYIDDIPFDTNEVIKNIDSGEAINLTNKEQEEEITIFKLFIKWVSLLFQID
jgi:hypothetical protein